MAWHIPDYGVSLFCTFYAACLPVHTLPQLYRALRVAAGKEEALESTTTMTEQSTVGGLDNLQKCTLAAMQSEIDTLREELKKGGKVHILVL